MVFAVGSWGDTRGFRRGHEGGKTRELALLTLHHGSTEQEDSQGESPTKTQSCATLISDSSLLSCGKMNASWFKPCILWYFGCSSPSQDINQEIKNKISY